MTDAAPDCITESRTARGFYWRYTHSIDEPHETLIAAIRLAATLAADERQK
jgi:hypothetical protein